MGIPLWRSGNTLVITLFTIVMVIGLLSLASEHLTADRTLAEIDRDRQRAQFAAESFIALVERKLYNLAASSTSRLKINIEDQTASTWFGFIGLDRGGNQPATEALYFDGCALRWRVEPIKVMTRTQAAEDDADASFFVNSERNPDLQHERRVAAGPNLIDDEGQHFYFRVAVESYVLKEPGDTTSVPWMESGKHLAMAQAQRVVQFEDVNAFRYLFNYVADSNTGDLEFHPGSPVTITGGAMRSNQRILLSTTGNVSYAIGDATIPVSLEAPDGIYRLRKEDLLAAGNPNPETVDAAGGAPNDTSTGIITVNGVAFETDNDSRADLAPHHQAVRDGSENRPVQADLDTYQAWNNGFLQPYWTVGPGVRLRKFATTNVYTIRETDPHFHPGLTSADTGLYATGLIQFRFPVNPGDPNNTQTFTDIWPLAPDASTTTVYGLSLTQDPFDATSTLCDQETGLPSLPVPLPPATTPPTPPNPVIVRRPVPAMRSLFDWSIAPNSRWSSGLVIRERGRHRIDPLNPVAVSANPNLSTENTYAAGDLVAYSNWMKANYVVYLGRAVDKDRIPGTDDDTLYENVDITDEFFAYSVSTSPTLVRDLLAHEDIITNRREQAWYTSRGQQNTRANLFTLNLERLNAFLASVIPATGSRLQAGRRYRDYFNGLIYLERTPRPFRQGDMGNAAIDYRPYAHPLVTMPGANLILPASPTGDNPGPFSVSAATLVPNSTNPILALRQQFLAPIVGNVDTGPMATPVLGTPGTWMVTPHQRAVRLDRATTLSRTMTFITPNTCYLWGDFNTSGGTPQPCAIYADQLIALSNAWLDSASASSTLPQATTTTYRAGFITHNVPTDMENRTAGGSGGAENIMRFLENWSAATFRLHGCVVVPGRMRHCRVPINGTNNQTFHQEPTYDYIFNEALLTSGGQPPASPKTTRATRVMSSVSNGR